MSNDNFKIRITSGDSVALGPGKAELLNLIDERGSISAAAKQMKMSYRRAWQLVDVMNQCFDQPLVLSSVGGIRGGGAQLTDLGRQVLENYHKVLFISQNACNKELEFISAHLKAPK